jgi:phosphoribosylglycinamide formyltransferase-1
MKPSMSELHNPKVMILASGSGSTAEAFIHATQDGRVDAEVGLVVCNKPPEEAGVYERVAELNRQYGLDIEAAHISKSQYPEGPMPRGQTLAESEAICRKAIEQGGYDHIALMGYMRIITGNLLEEFGYLPDIHNSRYQARLSNTHPGPLPETKDSYGIGASQRVLDLGLTASAHTFHLVAPEVDDGPVLDAHGVDVLPGDTARKLFARVQEREKARLPGDIDNFLKEQRAYHGAS